MDIWREKSLNGLGVTPYVVSLKNKFTLIQIMEYSRVGVPLGREMV